MDPGWSSDLKEFQPHILCGGQKNYPKKHGEHENVSKKAWWVKFNIIKTHNRASLTKNMITLDHIKCNSSSYYCVFFIKCCSICNTVLTKLIFKKVQRALKNSLAGTFLPPGSGLANPGLECQFQIKREKRNHSSNLRRVACRLGRLHFSTLQPLTRF